MQEGTNLEIDKKDMKQVHRQRQYTKIKGCENTSCHILNNRDLWNRARYAIRERYSILSIGLELTKCV